MNVNGEPSSKELVMVALGMDTPPIATLSLAVIVNVSVWVLLLLGVEYKLAKWVTDADVNPVIVGAIIWFCNIYS